MKTRWIALCLGTFLLVPAIWSQVNSPAQASKIGTISFQAAVVGTAEGKQASSEIQTQFAARSNELQPCKNRSKISARSCKPVQRPLRRLNNKKSSGKASA
ncbi:MAG TPA: hypothetical protein VMH31_04785 [Methylomirabilota bacterium]|nr:hypothetical protein [Methylomirabilota bacterium]